MSFRVVMEKMQALLHIIDLMLITSICAHGAYYFPVQLQELQFYLNVRFYCRFCRTDDGENAAFRDLKNEFRLPQ